MAHGAVDAEQLGTVGDVALAGQVLVGRDGGAGAERRDVGGERGDLLVGELDGLLLGLRSGGGSGHAARSDLEVDGGGADAVEVRAGVGALGTEAVAAGAVGLEELLALVDECVDLRGRLGGGAGREERVAAAGGEQTDEQQQGGGERGTTTGAGPARLAGRGGHELCRDPIGYLRT